MYLLEPQLEAAGMCCVFVRTAAAEMGCVLVRTALREACFGRWAYVARLDQTIVPNVLRILLLYSVVSTVIALCLQGPRDC